MFDKNLIIAMIASMVFLGVWYKFFMPETAPQTVSAPATLPSSTSGIKAGGAKKSDLKSANSAVLVEKTLETEFLKIVIDSRGAAVRHWFVKQKVKKSMPDLVNHQMTDGAELPSENLPFSTFPDINFTEAPSASANESRWTARLPSGLEVEKKYVISPVQAVDAEHSPELVRLSVAIRNPSKSPVAIEGIKLFWGPGLGTIESEEKENAKVTRVIAYPSPTKQAEKFKDGGYPFNNYKWAAVDNRYYLMAMMPVQGRWDHIHVTKSKEIPGIATLVSPALEFAPGELKTYEVDLYGGPKGYNSLKKMGLSLEHAVDFGVFGFLGKWALRALNYLKKITGNYGWAIILLTIFLQMLVLPLTIKSYQSTSAMKKLQPKIQELQKRYKDDSMRMNQEMMKLYKDSGTNPFGGCLPMVLQIPVFWAFFTMLRNSYELLGAPWLGWIHDLSLKDPFYVLPLVMGGGMFLQQKLTGPMGDPTQAKMMMFMPIIFTFMFLNFPSGLVLYWLTNSLVGITVQFILSRRGAAALPSKP